MCISSLFLLVAAGFRLLKTSACLSTLLIPDVGPFPVWDYREADFLPTPRRSLFLGPMFSFSLQRCTGVKLQSHRLAAYFISLKKQLSPKFPKEAHHSARPGESAGLPVVSDARQRGAVEGLLILDILVGVW